MRPSARPRRSWNRAVSLYGHATSSQRSASHAAGIGSSSSDWMTRGICSVVAGIEVVIVIPAELGGLDDRGHGTFAAGDLLVRPEGEDLIALELGVFLVGCQAHDAPVGIHRFGELVSLVQGVAEYLLHHPDDVVV